MSREDVTRLVCRSLLGWLILTAACGDAAPVADAGPDQGVVTGTLVTLDGSGSHDANGDALTYQWSFQSRPVGSGAVLSGATTVSATFTPDVDGRYVVRLIVNDEKVNSSPDTVAVSAASAMGGVVTIKGSGAGFDSTLGIPRYKMAMSRSAPNQLWAFFAVSGEDVFYSLDSGDSWLPIGDLGIGDHASVDIDDGDNVQVADRGDPEVIHNRLNYPGRSTGNWGLISHAFDDFGDLQGTGNICCNGSEVVVFMRASTTDQRITFARSTDRAASFPRRGVVCTATGNHRVGSCVVDGKVAAIVCDTDPTSGKVYFYMYQWQGQGFSKPVYGDIAVSINGWGLPRQYSFTQDEGRIMHLVWWEDTGSKRRIVHTFRHPDDPSWSPKVVVDTPDLEDISPILAAKGTNVYCFYLRSNMQGWVSVFGKRWNGVTRQWGAAVEISEATQDCRYPQTVQKAGAGAPFLPVLWTEGTKIKYRRVLPF